ncbi:hypothetical protein [Tahibacter amnicola]|uniref:Uncharacterized protein n=1 Tax=Tahibacter amnicola TaxID=2976241 RepID=A0ABY6BEB5_9GAMM|nr:hypothetical protein [Tahibacter amnicola]UXI68373.1 hypothetical protein N4264_01595 [Tahibacter amnicola]
MRTRKMPLRRRLLAAFALSVSSTAVFAYMCGGAAEGWTITQIEMLTANVETQLTTFTTTFVNQMRLKFDDVVSAVGGATAQESIATKQVVDAVANSEQTLASAIKALQEADEVQKNVLDFHPVTGQGFDPCGTSLKNKTMDMAFGRVHDRAKATVGSNDMAPGRLVASTAEAMQNRLKEHRRLFCTKAEADAGLCTLSELPGGDTNAALLFEGAKPDSLAAKAREAYIQHVLGEPDGALPQAAGNTPAGQSFLIDKNRKSALLSVPAYSLARIAAANTRDATMSDKSPNEVLRLRINQYFGGKEAEAWSGQLARMADRGLVLEATKVAGLETWLRYQQYQQNQRMEANLAALLVAASAGLDETTQAAAQRAQREALSRKVQ